MDAAIATTAANLPTMPATLLNSTAPSARQAVPT